MTGNPSRIPLHRILHRAAPGLALYALLGFSSAAAALWALTILVGWNLSVLSGWWLPFLAGLFALQLPRLKDRFLTRSVARKRKLIARVLQKIDEWSRLYVNMIIDREERKLDRELLDLDNGRGANAIDRLFELYLKEIIQREGLRCGEPKLQIVNVKLPHVKLKLLLHQMGYRKLKRQVLTILNDPTSVYPAWPIDLRDRRTMTKNQARSAERRRKYEQPEFLEEIAATGLSIREKLQASWFSYSNGLFRDFANLGLALVSISPIILIRNIVPKITEHYHLGKDGAVVVTSALFVVACSGLFLLYEGVSGSRRPLLTIGLCAAAFVLWYEGWLLFSVLLQRGG